VAASSSRPTRPARGDAQAQERAAAAGLSAEAAERPGRDADDARSPGGDRCDAGAGRAGGGRPVARGGDRRGGGRSTRQRRQLESQTQELQAENTRLKAERDDLEGALTGALSEVAGISQTARGVVVSLPDILFDTNKATLKPNARSRSASSPASCRCSRRSTCASRATRTATGSDELNDRLSRTARTRS
jgi:outer membrane protein OmpA-like peptidoglycan-associated protein